MKRILLATMLTLAAPANADTDVDTETMLLWFHSNYEKFLYPPEESKLKSTIDQAMPVDRRAGESVVENGIRFWGGEIEYCKAIGALIRKELPEAANRLKRF